MKHKSDPPIIIITIPLLNEYLVCLLSVSDSAIPWTVAHQAPVHGISQARIPGWVAISFSRVPSWPRDGNPHLLAGRFLTNEPPGKPLTNVSMCKLP